MGSQFKQMDRSEGDTVQEEKKGLQIQKVSSKAMFTLVNEHNCVSVSISAYPHSDLLVKYNY